MKGKDRGRRSRNASFLRRGAFREREECELIAVAEDVRTLSLSAGLRF